MPSTNPRTAVLAVAVAVAGYAAVVASRFLLGLLLAALVYLVGWFVVRLSPGNPIDDMTRLRIGVAGGVAALALVYAVVIAASVLLGVLAAGAVLVVAWITSPLGPVARWLDRR
jgi:hypothetical protein